MREQGTLVAPRPWAEEGVGRASLNEHEKPTVLRLRWRRDYPDPGPTLSGGVGRTEKKWKEPSHIQTKSSKSHKQAKDKNSKPHNPRKKRKTLEERRRLESQLATRSHFEGHLRYVESPAGRRCRRRSVDTKSLVRSPSKSCSAPEGEEA